MVSGNGRLYTQVCETPLNVIFYYACVLEINMTTSKVIVGIKQDHAGAL